MGFSFMAFSATDLANIESAIVEIAMGKRVVTVEVGGKTRSFQAAGIENLLRLRDVVKADIEDAAGTGIFVKASFTNVA